jgi:excinuclease UvrABC nuclease subunit
MNPSLTVKIKRLPKGPGVYIFKDEREKILYVGKAKDLRKRVKSHFERPEQHMWDFTPQVKEIDFIGTENENEALLVESQLIKKFQPKFNVLWKDDKDYFYVVASRDDHPRVRLTHQPRSLSLDFCVGPFTRGREIKALIRELRQIFPYRSCENLAKKPCLYKDLDLCLAPCDNKRTKKTYKKMLKAFFVLLELYRGAGSRIEGYDISNTSGELAVGSMVVFDGADKKPGNYRKFRIKRVKGQNDVASLREVLLRREKHPEWLPADLVLLDGGKGQLKAARGLETPVVALAKIRRSGPPGARLGADGGKLFSPYSKGYIRLAKLPEDLRNTLLRVRDEAHRFAITYHKKRRLKKLKDKH